jgi:hypothetical protein
MTTSATLGDEVCRPISNFFSLGYMDEEINATHIVLVPKKAQPLSVTDFRPISLCNVIYKIFSKVLANCLKEVVPLSFQQIKVPLSQGI